jgi:hypothetical protein
MARPTAALLRHADALGLPADAPERRECRALSLWLAEQPKAQPAERAWSLEEIGEEMRRMEEAG